MRQKLSPVSTLFCTILFMKRRVFIPREMVFVLVVAFLNLLASRITRGGIFDVASGFCSGEGVGS